MTTPLYCAISVAKPVLRVGILLDHWMVSAWISEVLASVQTSGVARLTTVILNQDPEALNPRPSLRLRDLFNPAFAGTLLWRLYTRLDSALRPHLTAPFEPVDVRPLLAEAKRIDVASVRSSDVNRFRPADVEAVQKEKLDVILRFGFDTLRGDILKAATYGVWSIHHGDDRRYRGGPAGFWEMYDSNPLTGTVLKVIDETQDGGRVIYRSYGSTRSFESVVVNRYWTYRKAIPFVRRCLRRVYEHGHAGLQFESASDSDTRPIRKMPRNGEMALFLIRGTIRILTNRLRRWLGFRTGHWFLGVTRGVAPGEPLAGKVKPVNPPRGRFWADPILARDKGSTFLFFEDFEYRSGIGRISVAELDPLDRPQNVRPALETKHHLSYPFVFQWNGEHFMIPETASVRAVQLFRATNFPVGWEYVKDLLTDIRAVDATVFEHEGLWFLMSSVSESGGSSWDELFCFVSETPLGPWEPHPMNPIVSDVRSARPGGPLFRRNGRLYRPGQNSAQMYGHSLAVMEVTELSPQGYSERLAFHIEPDWLPRIRGCHTMTMAGDLMVLDCRKRKWMA